MFVPVWVFVVVAVLVLFRGRLSLTYDLREARQLWPRLTPFGKYFAMKRWLQFRLRGTEEEVAAEIQRALATPESVDACFRWYAHNRAMSFPDPEPLWAALFKQCIVDALLSFDVERLEEFRREHAGVNGTSS